MELTVVWYVLAGLAGWLLLALTILMAAALCGVEDITYLKSLLYATGQVAAGALVYMVIHDSVAGYATRNGWTLIPKPVLTSVVSGLLVMLGSVVPFALDLKVKGIWTVLMFVFQVGICAMFALLLSMLWLVGQVAAAGFRLNEMDVLTPVGLIIAVIAGFIGLGVAVAAVFRVGQDVR